MSYQPRICTFTQRPILPSDKISTQLVFAVLDEDGRATSEKMIINVCGKIRQEGLTDKFISQLDKN